MVHSNDSDESDNEYESGDYENSVSFYEIIFEYYIKLKNFKTDFSLKSKAKII